MPGLLQKPAYRDAARFRVESPGKKHLEFFAPTFSRLSKVQTLRDLPSAFGLSKTFDVLSTVKDLMDCGINVYFQKEQMTLLDESGRLGMFTPILIATLGTCAEMERENIRFRLNSGLANYKAKGGRVGRKAGSVKSDETKKEEYRDVIVLLKRGYSVRNTAKLTGKGISTVQRVKNDFVN